MRVTSTSQPFFLVCAMFLSGGQALAQDRPPEHGQGGPHRRPPEAAFTACADLKQDDVCEVQLKERTIEGKCMPAREQEDKLVCVPEHPHGPPPADAAE